MTIHLFCGYDPREAIGFHVFCHSVITRATDVARITPLSSMGLPQGSNTFTLSRFLVPHLMGFQGHAIFADGCDMLMLADIVELDDLFDPRFAVQVVQHPEYTSQHARKYIGTEMECDQSAYARKNWASLMLMNCEHRAWRGLDFLSVGKYRPLQLLQFSELLDEEIGPLPACWNVLIDEDQDDADARLLHWTAGLPTFRHYRNARRSRDWFDACESMMETISA